MTHASMVMGRLDFRTASLAVPKLRLPRLSQRTRALLMIGVMISPCFLSDAIGYCVERAFYTADEIADVTGIDPEEVDSIKRSARAPISLENPVGDGEGSQFGQLIADEQAESPYERAVEILTMEALQDALENLSYRERRALELRYGRGDEHLRTLDEVGRAFNVTRERIRQIETQSLKKLQHVREAQQLRDDVKIASGYTQRSLARQPGVGTEPL